VSQQVQIQALVAATRERLGPIDLFVSNAGIIGQQGGIELDDALWEQMWHIHLMAHVWAARAVVPDMLARGGGGFVVTASAAGLLNIVESAPYGVTKHAAVGFAEWLRIAYGRKGLQVVCLCPQAVDTEMTRAGAGSAGLNGVISPAVVAQAVMETLHEGRFLALPHPEVAEYLQAKAADYDRWLGGMQKLYALHATGSGLGAVK
jgi:NAD(P)-dependent dehydrogenase (short-subunit alcohol dehydrogenase family)